MIFTTEMETLLRGWWPTTNLKIRVLGGSTLELEMCDGKVTDSQMVTLAGLPDCEVLTFLDDVCKMMRQRMNEMPRLRVASPLSPECPCGIHRSRCEYHGAAK